jgi:hypothetical protein
MSKDHQQPFAVNAAPIAELTWAMGPTILLGTEEQTGFVKADFSRPIEILGIGGVVIPVLPLAGGFPSPTLDDIDVKFELDQADKYTSNVTEGQTGSGFVPFKDLLTTAQRLMRLCPNVVAPDILMSFKWRQFTQGTQLYQGAIISATLYARYLTDDERTARGMGRG